MPPLPPPAPADRLAGIIDLLCRSVAAQSAGGRLAGPLIILIWSRLRRIAGRFAGLAARFRAGKLVRRAATGRRPARPGRPQGKRPLPQGSAWLVRLVPQAAAGASQLRYLLAEPEMAALIAAAPQARRLLRPLCRMLGVRLPPGPPAPGSAPPAAPDPPAAAEPIGTPQPLRASPPLRPPPHLRAGFPPVRA